MTAVADLRGAVLGKGYRLGARLGIEADGTYEASHERVPGRFVLHLFPVEGLDRPDAPIRIHRAAALASLLRDPHVLQTLDFGAAGEASAFVVTEKTDGHCLAEILAAGECLSLDRALALVDAAAAALGEAHAHGLVHGDLRPAHILVPRSGQPVARVAGFGWAMELRAIVRDPPTSAALAPEQEEGTVIATDPRTDQFGLGVLVYQALSGRLPFPASGGSVPGGLPTPTIPGSATARGGAGPPPALADLVRGVPAAVDDVLRRALAPAPAARFADVAELATRLREAARRPAAATPEAPRRDAPRAPALASAATVTAGAAARGSAPVPLTRRQAPQDASHRSSTFLPGMTPVPAQSALPGTAADDVTEELELHTMWPALLIPKDDALDLELLFHPEDELPGERPEDWQRPDRGGGGGGDPDRDALDELSFLPPPDRQRAGRTAGPPSTGGSGTAGGRSSHANGGAITEAAPATTSSHGLRSEGSTTGSSRRPSSTSSRWWVAVGGVLAIAAGGAAGAWFARSRSTRATTSMPTRTTRNLERRPGPPPSPKAALPPAGATSPATPGVVGGVLPAVSPTVAPGEVRVIAPPPPGAATIATPATCVIRVASRPASAELWLDGKFTGLTPVVGLLVPCGVHRLSLRRSDSGGVERSEIIETSAGRPFTGDYPLD